MKPSSFFFNIYFKPRFYANNTRFVLKIYISVQRVYARDFILFYLMQVHCNTIVHRFHISILE